MEEALKEGQEDIVERIDDVEKGLVMELKKKKIL